MAEKMVSYMLNDNLVTAPDEEQWQPVLVGENHSNLQVRSFYWRLTWSKTVADACMLDWFEYDNQALTSLTTRPNGKVDQIARYTDVTCVQVSATQTQNNATRVTAEFIVGVS